MLNLVPAIHAIESQISDIHEKYQKELAPYQSSLKELRRINEACETCGGEGKILRSRVCAEDDRPNPDDPTDWHKCPDCKGTGLQKKQ